jgi:hypothetical protein
MGRAISPYLATNTRIWKEMARYGNFLKVSTSRWAQRPSASCVIYRNSK